jgi:hypothetical protein
MTEETRCEVEQDLCDAVVVAVIGDVRRHFIDHPPDVPGINLRVKAGAKQSFWVKIPTG